MDLFAYPTALVFAAIMAGILISPIILLSGVLFHGWLKWTTNDKIDYYDPITRRIDKFLGNLDTDNLEDVIMFIIFTGSCLFNIVMMLISITEILTNGTAVPVLVKAYFGMWLQFGVWAAAPIFVIGIVLGGSYGAKYLFATYDKVVRRLATVESKAHTHDESK